MTANPFTPTFGISPPVLVGRAGELAAFEEALERGPGAPGLVTLYVGMRGTGKTVMLNEIEDLARSRGWAVITETATKGLSDRLVFDAIPRTMDMLGMTEEDLKVTGVGAFGVSLRWDSDETQTMRRPTLRTLLADVAEFQQARDAGILITVDEIHAGPTDDLRELATAVQHSIREDRWVSFAAAGLPAAIKSMLNDDVITFLRRADRHNLGRIQPLAVERALKEPIEAAGRKIRSDALQQAADATGGYGFMIQLVGYYLWDVAEGDMITAEDVAEAVPLAEHRIGTLMIEPTLDDITPSDRRYLSAMSIDDRQSSTRAVAERMDMPLKQAGVSRDRLLAAGIISAPTRGWVDHEVPYMRQYLRDHPWVE